MVLRIQDSGEYFQSFASAANFELVTKDKFFDNYIQPTQNLMTIQYRFSPYELIVTN